MASAPVTLAVMTRSRCKTAERLPGQCVCRPCLTGYQRERRARRRLEKRAPELLANWREAAGQVEGLLRGIGGLSTHPKCCASVHWAASPMCACACHKARTWLDSVRLVEGSPFLEPEDG
jgi:hypothetical protein